MKKSELLSILLLASLLLAIGLSPRFSVGRLSGGKSIDLRVEDIILLFWGLFWLANILASKLTKFTKPPLFFPILTWLGIGLFSVLTNLAFMNVAISKSLFYLLKEIEYFFLFFYVFYHVKSISSVKILLKLWMLIGFIHATWIAIQLIFGLRITYYYGPTTFIEPEGTSPGGGFLLIIFIFLLNVLLYYYLNLKIPRFHKIIISLLIASPVIGILSSGSRGTFAGLAVATMASFFLYSIRKKVFIKSFAVLFLIVVLTFSVFSISNSRVLSRLFDVSEIKKNLNPDYSLSRPGIWIQQLTQASHQPLFLLFGYGKSVAFEGIGESHNQYIRNFLETGIFGLLAFLFLLYCIIKESLKGFYKNSDPFLIGISAGFFCSTVALMTIALFAESFIVVKINEAYWFFGALTFASLYINKKFNHERI